MLDYVKSALRKKQQMTSKAEHLRENHGNTKKINFQFHDRKFSQQMYSILSYYHRRVTRGGLGRVLILGKSALVLAIYRLSFSFKMQLLSFSRKKPKFSLLGLSFLCF